MKTAHLELVVPNLHATTPASLPFARDVSIRAFVLERERGNVLMYSAPAGAADLDAIDGLGGIARQYLNHWHEAMFGFSDALDVPLVVHAAERDHVAEHWREPTAAFARRHRFAADLEVVPTPGHTPGATAFLWDTGEHRVLFTGDTLYLKDGEWRAAVLPTSDRGAYLDSLELIRELDFDVLVPWAAGAGEAPHALTDDADRRRRVNAVIDRIWRGADH